MQNNNNTTVNPKLLLTIGGEFDKYREHKKILYEGGGGESVEKNDDMSLAFPLSLWFE